MDERRKLDRKYLIVYSRVFERKLGRMLGYLGDFKFVRSDDHQRTGADFEQCAPVAF